MSPRARIEVVLHPGFDALYYSFYLEGLYRLPVRLGESARRVPYFGHHGLSMRVIRKGLEKRVFLSASDGPGINREAMEWCDRYAKVNLDREALSPADAAKSMPIGPSFAVRTWAPLRAWARAFATALVSGRQLSDLREHVASYRRQYRYRLPESAYEPGRADADYVFFASRLWRKEARANRFRANFLEACRDSDLRVEGGFVARSDGVQMGFDHLTVARRYEMREYLDGTRRSLVVFNTPTVGDCHGWKLGEYLALGKAIISTPPLRDLPAPLEHRRQLHLVDGSRASIVDAIREIRSDSAYRARLERSARLYYERVLAPEVVVARCLEGDELA